MRDTIIAIKKEYPYDLLRVHKTIKGTILLIITAGSIIAAMNPPLSVGFLIGEKLIGIGVFGVCIHTFWPEREW